MRRKSFLAAILAMSMLAVPVMAEEPETETVETEAIEAEEAEAEAVEEEMSLEDLIYGCWNVYRIEINGEADDIEKAQYAGLSFDHGRFKSSNRILGVLFGEGSYCTSGDEVTVTIGEDEFTFTTEFFHEDEPHSAGTVSEATQAWADAYPLNRVKASYTETVKDNSDPLAPKMVDMTYTLYLERDWEKFAENKYNLLGNTYRLESGAEIHFYRSESSMACVDLSFDGEMTQEGVWFSTSEHQLTILWEGGTVNYIPVSFSPEGITVYNAKDESSLLYFEYLGTDQPEEEAEEETLEEETLEEESLEAIVDELINGVLGLIEEYEEESTEE